MRGAVEVHPAPVIAFLLPFSVLAAAALALRPSADTRTWSVLVVGLVVLLILAALGPLQRSNATPRYDAARRVVLRALFALMLLFSLCCAWIAAAGGRWCRNCSTRARPDSEAA